MNKQLVAAIAMSVATVGLLSQTYAQQQADPTKAAAPATEDIIYMRDGRVLHGQIIVETSKAITFEYHDKTLNNKTKLNLKPEEIAEIMRDQPMTGAPAAADADDTDDPDADAAVAEATVKSLDYKPSYGSSRFETNDPNVPSFYIVPMQGQFGTDVRADVYRPVIEDIRKNKPTMVVIDLRSADSFPPEIMYPFGFDQPKTDPANEQSLIEFEDYRDLVALFRDELRDVPQVLWIEDSDGISATVALAWDQIYMHPTARFGGMISILEGTGANKWPDADVRAKMMAAILGIAKAFSQKGNYSLALADAMLNPEFNLSGSWRGRVVDWQLDRQGEYVVDENSKRTANFTAKTAEDLCLSKGTAGDLDDLALLLGYREYRLIEGKQNELTLDYVAAWRRTFARCQQLMREYEKNMSMAGGGDALRYLTKGKANLEAILNAMNRYKAVEIRMESDYGASRLALTVNIEQLKEQIQALRARANAGRSSGGGGGGGGRAGSGGGPGQVGP